jgi:hypothetical protein
MRRLFSLLLLFSLMVAQAPIACVSGGAHAAEPDGGAALHLTQRAAHDAAGHGHHGGAGHTADGAGHMADGAGRDAAAPERSSAELPCAALARCHWAAMPEPGSALLPVRDRIAAPVVMLHDRPVGPVAAYPTPPPRILS